jgi:hypothetical protein
MYDVGIGTYQACAHGVECSARIAHRVTIRHHDGLQLRCIVGILERNALSVEGSEAIQVQREYCIPCTRYHVPTFTTRIARCFVCVEGLHGSVGRCRASRVRRRTCIRIDQECLAREAWDEVDTLTLMTDLHSNVPPWSWPHVS